jgi:hypothetical protein
MWVLRLAETLQHAVPGCLSCQGHLIAMRIVADTLVTMTLCHSSIYTARPPQDVCSHHCAPSRTGISKPAKPASHRAQLAARDSARGPEDAQARAPYVPNLCNAVDLSEQRQAPALGVTSRLETQAAAACCDMSMIIGTVLLVDPTRSGLQHGCQSLYMYTSLWHSLNLQRREYFDLRVPFSVSIPGPRCSHSELAKSCCAADGRLFW